MTFARSAETQIHFRSGIVDLAGLAERDVWGHWGAYYGPMVTLLRPNRPIEARERARDAFGFGPPTFHTTRMPCGTSAKE